ncbi:hypothetical protein [Halanaerobium salsuginis]|jgi:nickel transport protein|uniref:Nickel transport protein n=1 Tax=Halanaerobium salsuginis TaxID=29563 RepID=A0A1I4K4N2_9FIRM|nr:hypothetical protein [Halanaerobium salsuginis]SFL73724.1 nickel transport protein [Halanaerobium salsuginis]
MNKNKFYSFFTILLLIVVLSFCFSTAVLAHRVILYAYVEGSNLEIEAGFSDGSPARLAKLEIYDKQDNLLATGETNEAGLAEVAIPARTDLKIILKAGMGHQAEYQINESEIAKDFKQPADQTLDNQNSAVIGSSNELSKAELREIVAEEVSREVKPLRKQIAKLITEQEKPGISEILGGIGYIIGLMGVALYFISRKRSES